MRNSSSISGQPRLAGAAAHDQVVHPDAGQALPLTARSGGRPIHRLYQRGIERMEALIYDYDLLEYSRVVHAGMESQVPTDAGQVLESTVAAMHEHIAEAEAKVTYDPAPARSGGPDPTRADFSESDWLRSNIAMAPLPRFTFGLSATIIIGVFV